MAASVLCCLTEAADIYFTACLSKADTGFGAKTYVKNKEHFNFIFDVPVPFKAEQIPSVVIDHE